jgi:tyrosyl-tRNA synthetase
MLLRTGIASSKGEARRLLQSGAVYVNNVRQGSDVTLDRRSLASPSFIVLRSGKKNYHLVWVAE